MPSCSGEVMSPQGPGRPSAHPTETPPTALRFRAPSWGCVLGTRLQPMRTNHISSRAFLGSAKPYMTDALVTFTKPLPPALCRPREQKDSCRDTLIIHSDPEAKGPRWEALPVATAVLYLGALLKPAMELEGLRHPQEPLQERAHRNGGFFLYPLNLRYLPLNLIFVGTLEWGEGPHHSLAQLGRS